MKTYPQNTHKIWRHVFFLTIMNIHYYLVDRDFKIKQNIYRESSLKYKQVAQGRCKD